MNWKKIISWRVAGLLALFLSIPLWQYSNYRSMIPDTYKLRASSGMHSQQKFLYFLYYKNLFPIATLKSGTDINFFYVNYDVPVVPSSISQYSEAEADRLLREEGDSLVMEWGHTLRIGNLLKAYLYLPHAWVRGTPQDANIRFIHAVMFTLALMALLFSFWRMGWLWPGVLVVVALGSNPFQLYEVHARDNVFSWPITSFIWLLAVFLPFLLRRPVTRAYAVGALVFAAVYMATIQQIRPENTALLGGCVFALALYPRWKLAIRGAAIVALLLGFALVHKGWGAYFDSKIAEATAVVEKAGGHPYRGFQASSHNLWHPIWCGLGDFAEDRGFRWKDHQAVSFAEPILKEKYGVDMPWWWGVKAKTKRDGSDYYDEAKLYYKHYEDTPHYTDVLREKVVAEIKADPLWYLGILKDRAQRIFQERTPFSLRWPSLGIDASFHVRAWMILLALAWLVFRRRWEVLAIVVFSLPLIAPALLIFSGGNTPFYGVWHLLLVSLALAPSLSKFRAIADKRSASAG